MATLREYFDTDVKQLSSHDFWSYRTKDGKIIGDIIAKIALDLEGNAKYWYFYIPAIDELNKLIATLLASDNLKNCYLGEKPDDFYVEMSMGDNFDKVSSQTTQFTKRIHFYVDFDLTQEVRLNLIAEILTHGYFATIRDREFAAIRSKNEKPQAFISHDSRDKDPFVRQLVNELAKFYCFVWYDEFSLKVGDSLRENIERGLRETKKCIVILSPNFLSNKGWGLAEYDSIYTREILEKKNVILPVWLNVSVDDVYKYSPRLADKVGISSTLGVEEVARQLANAVKNSS